VRGLVVVVCLAAALFIGKALYWHEPPADEPAVTVALPPAASPSPALPSETTGLATPRPQAAWGSDTASISTAGSFAHSRIHTAAPLPASSFAALRRTDGEQDDEIDTFNVPRDASMDFGPVWLHGLSRGALCRALESVARANDLPVPFFANLIWQESSFQSRTISRAGALGIAQFMPVTAVQQGLPNPFEPVHALYEAGKLLRKLNEQFGNLGLAAAAYNAGPQRVRAWMTERRTLPNETRAYVVRITGRPADQWRSAGIDRDPDATLMPARAPCAEVVNAVLVQREFVRIAKLMAELAKPANAQVADGAAPEKRKGEKQIAEKPTPEKQKAEEPKPVKPTPEQQKAEGQKAGKSTPVRQTAEKPEPEKQKAEKPTPQKTPQKQKAETPKPVKQTAQKPMAEKQARSAN